ncbi:MAG: glycosyltransferase family 4 protein, partial [bacterium]
VVVSEAAGRDFDYWPDKARRVRVVYNGVALEDFPRDFDRAAVRRDLGIPHDAIVVGHVGLLSERKRQHITLAAAQRAVATEPRLHFLIVGDASLHTRDYDVRLRRDAKNLGLENHVTFLPFTRDIARIYAALDLNLLISDDEGFGRVIVEAAAYNVPTIGTRIGGIPEIIKAGNSGELIALDDVDALANHLVKLARDDARRQSLGDAAKATLLERFTIAKHVEAMEQVFSEVLAI